MKCTICGKQRSMFQVAMITINGEIYGWVCNQKSDFDAAIGVPDNKCQEALRKRLENGLANPA